MSDIRICEADTLTIRIFEYLKVPCETPFGSPDQQDIIRFFDYLFRRVTGGGPLQEGLRTQFVTTNYDFVIETILDASLNDSADSFINYTYRGFTPSSVEPGHEVIIHTHWLVQHLIKVNGGFEILPEGNDGYSLNYGKRSESEIGRNPPVLILPSREQNYTDPYFRAIFPKSIRLLRESTILILVGYSFPEDDALIRFMLRQFAEEHEDGLVKFIFYVDLSDNGDKRGRLVEVFPWLESPSAFPRIFLYQGGFAQFVKKCMSFVE
jgi:SIR2-like domain